MYSQNLYECLLCWVHLLCQRDGLYNKNQIVAGNYNHGQLTEKWRILIFVFSQGIYFQHSKQIQSICISSICCPFQNVVALSTFLNLYRYERTPKKILTVDNINHDIAPMEGVPSRLASYLHHQRWVWNLQPAHDNVHFESLDMRSIGYILDVITK